PEFLINQIKAGEVIERPASLIKELLENSIDAKASKIEINIRGNGLELIHIGDNGCGMFFEDLALAFARHATSKIDKFDDLYNLSSYGFRGEALASLASIARLECFSSPSEDLSAGGKITIHAGQVLAHIHLHGQEVGTSLWIKDLFYNTPARLKFIKSQNAEKMALKKMIQAFLLAHPEIQFSIRVDDRPVEFHRAQSTTTEGYVERLTEVLSSFDKNKLYHFDRQYDNHRLWGFISPEGRKSNNKNQFLLCNQRLFFDKAIHQIILQTMQSCWHGENGDYVIFLEIAPEQIDVNVHPNKTMIKFFKSGVVYSLLSTAIKEILPVVDQSGLGNNTQPTLSLSTAMLPSSPDSMPDWDIASTASLFKSYFSPVDDFIFFSSSQESCYLLKISRLYQEYWKKHHTETIAYLNKLENPECTPLLISHPFSVGEGLIDHFLPELKKYGWELDRLNQDYLLLRATPSYLNPLPTVSLAQGLISYLIKSNHPSQSLEELWAKFWDEELPAMNDPGPALIETLIKSFSLSLLTQRKILKAINGQNMELFLKS
ncbi:MAG: DNA mismatch repair endonuclease MutL, partial [Pseudomonadota bacterium]